MPVTPYDPSTLPAPPPADPGPTPTPEAPSTPTPTTFDPQVAALSDQLQQGLEALRRMGLAVPGPAPTSTSRFQVAPADQPLLDAALAEMRRSPTASGVLQQLERSQVKLTVLDDASFDAMDKQGSAAVYDPPSDTIYMRRSWLEKSPGKSASLLAHEGQHALDDFNGVGTAALQQRTTALARGGAVTPAIVEQAGWEVGIAKEARGYLVQGLVLKELGLVDPAKVGGPLLVAAQGSNDRATYDQVFRLLVSSPEGGYNPDGRTVEPFVL
jgi:hypothetical protein